MSVCVIERFTESLASIHWMWVASLHLQFWQSEYFLSLPSVSCGTKTPPTENHCFRQMVGIYFNFLSKKGNSPTKVSFSLYAVHAESLLLCLTLCDPMDCSQPGSSVCGIFQARTLEWVATAYSRGSSGLRIQSMLHVSPARQADSLPLGLGVFPAGAIFNSWLGN